MGTGVAAAQAWSLSPVAITAAVKVEQHAPVVQRGAETKRAIEGHRRPWRNINEKKMRKDFSRRDATRRDYWVIAFILSSGNRSTGSRQPITIQGLQSE